MTAQQRPGVNGEFNEFQTKRYQKIDDDSVNLVRELGVVSKERNKEFIALQESMHAHSPTPEQLMSFKIRGQDRLRHEIAEKRKEIEYIKETKAIVDSWAKPEEV